MLTAVLSARKRTEDGGLRAGLTLGGRSVIVWQAELVRSLGCERIICLCDSTSAEILELQQHVEALGHEFHTVRSSLQLVALLRADDLLVVLADGLLVNEEITRELLLPAQGPAKAVVTVPSDHALASVYPEDFERIDADRSWAGVLAMRAAHAQKLADLPPDGEILSLLLRIALQGRTPTAALPFGRLREGDWLLASNQASIADRQSALIKENAEIVPWTAPFDALAARLTRTLAPKGIAQGGIASSAAAIVVFLAAALLAAFGFAAAGVAAAAIAAFAASLGHSWGSLRKALFGREGKPTLSLTNKALSALAAIPTLVLALRGDETHFALFALPLFAIGMMHLASHTANARRAAFWQDYTLHFAILALCAVLGVLAEGTAILGLAALAQLLLRSSRD